MPAECFAIPLPSGPCPHADNPEAILLWLYWKHLGAGRIAKRREHADPFWCRIDEKRHGRLRLADELRADPAWERRVQKLAAIFSLDLSGLDKEAQIEAVTTALVPMRFHLSSELALLGEDERAAEVLVAAY
ncbi:MAG: hypothetical protein HGA45_17805 [Chloroflexales bacterium]|nr:hypothetical protein [Chloroflexales bacterium]